MYSSLQPLYSFNFVLQATTEQKTDLINTLQDIQQGVSNPP